MYECNNRSHFLTNKFIIFNNIRNPTAQTKLLKAFHFQTTFEHFESSEIVFINNFDDVSKNGYSKNEYS